MEHVCSYKLLTCSGRLQYLLCVSVCVCVCLLHYDEWLEISILFILNLWIFKKLLHSQDKASFGLL